MLRGPDREAVKQAIAKGRAEAQLRINARLVECSRRGKTDATIYILCIGTTGTLHPKTLSSAAMMRAKAFADFNVPPGSPFHGLRATLAFPSAVRGPVLRNHGLTNRMHSALNCLCSAILEYPIAAAVLVCFGDCITAKRESAAFSPISPGQSRCLGSRQIAEHIDTGAGASVAGFGHQRTVDAPNNQLSERRFTGNNQPFEKCSRSSPFMLVGSLPPIP